VLCAQAQPESLAMPPQNRVGLDQEESVARAGKEARENDEQTPLVGAQLRALDGAECDDELLAEHGVLGQQLRARSREVADEAAHYAVFSDATLVEMAARRPTSALALRTVPGVGPKKLARVGEVFLRLLTE